MTFPMPTFMPASGGALTSVVQQDSATGSVSVTWPSVNAGDLAVCLNQCSQTGAVYPTDVVPTGFTGIHTQTATSGSVYYRYRTSYKLCTGSESGTLNGMSGDGFATRMLLVIFRGDAPINSAAAAGIVTGTPTDSDPGSLTILASGGTPPLLVVGYYSCYTGTIDPMTFTASGTPVADGTIGASNSNAAAWKFYLDSPADIVIDMADEGSKNALFGCYIEIT